MIRTEIELEGEDARWLEREARSRRVSVGKIVHSLIRNVHASTRPHRKRGSIKRAEYHGLREKFPFVGCVKGGKTSDVRQAGFRTTEFN